ncbi:hypothetical protein ABER23_07960 [Paenibacillus lautus]|uniref:hypothetical protein n=1 Tax=Paenibacillus lautus TaxID=1401 RepID=UPI003D2C6F6F
MSEQNKIDEIKEALAAATPGPWHSYATEVFIETGPIAKLWGDGMRGEFKFDNHGNNAPFIAKSPEYITYLLQEIERKNRYLERISVTFGEFECQRLAREAL